MPMPKPLTIPFARDALSQFINEIPDTPQAGADPQLASWSEGFGPITMQPLHSGGKPPEGPDFNGILSAISAHIVYQNGGGIYTFSQEYVDKTGGYDKDSVLIGDDGSALWVSLSDDNAENFNTASTVTQWVKISSAGVEQQIEDILIALALKADKTTQVIAGTGLIGGGNLQANRTLSVDYGTTAGTAAQGNDSRIVNSAQTSGNQTIAGVKTFSSFPVTPSTAPTASYQAANKKYVDDKVIGAAPALFVKPVRGRPLLEKTGVTSVRIPAGLNAMVGSTLITLSSAITLTLAANLVGSTAVAGTDYFVYLRPNGTAYISASDTEPEGRLIAGFHYGLTGHSEAPSGNKTEADMVKLRGINAHTFWDLTWRANKWTNRGLTFDGINWIDIYLADEEYAVRGWSKAGGWIAGGTIEQGRKFPIIPEMYGGNGSATYGKLTPFVAWDMLNAAGMEPISYKQFAHAMYGVEEGLPASGIETVVGRIEHYPRLTSRYGVEQATGVQWTWGADFGSSSSGTWNNFTDGRGQVYSGVQVVLLGARRGHAAGQPGSRASHWSSGLTNSDWNHGVRGLRDHLELD